MSRLLTVCANEQHPAVRADNQHNPRHHNLREVRREVGEAHKSAVESYRYQHGDGKREGCLDATDDWLSPDEAKELYT